MLFPGDKIKHRETEEIFIMVERLPVSWVKVFEKLDDPDVEIQIFPPTKIHQFIRIRE